MFGSLITVDVQKKVEVEKYWVYIMTFLALYINIDIYISINLKQNRSKFVCIVTKAI